MELTQTENISKTISGLFVKFDRNIGLLAYSPFTGLTYAIHQNEAQKVVSWLQQKTPVPDELFKNSLGAGWVTPLDEFVASKSRLLPSRNLWETLPAPEYPILINWFLTGNCPLNCVYCYAEDLMRGNVPEPSETNIHDIAEKILALKPLVVVLTGGDPLSSPFLEIALNALSGNVGIVLDTSAYSWSEEKLRLFKKHNVNVRVSLDSEIPKLNQRQRPLLKNTKNSRLTAIPAIEAICRCLEEDIVLTVQTVATKKNANALLGLGDKLFRMGVKSWRVFEVSRSRIKYGGYIKLSGQTKDSGEKYSGKKARGPYDHNFELIMRAASDRWQNKIDLQVTYNVVPNAVILVGPDGVFYTESNTHLGKVVIDELSPKAPSIASIGKVVNLLAHAERYLNLTYKKEIMELP